MHSMVASSVWQRRTNKIIAAAVVIIGLTMMISTIPQCIYIGVIFIVLALGWLGWIRMKEKKSEEEGPRTIAANTASPVLFIMASQHLPHRPMRPSMADPNDKPPSYDQVLRLDELPPDYFSVLSAKPPRYEDIGAMCNGVKGWPGTIAVDMGGSNLPAVHTSAGVVAGDRSSVCSNSNSSSGSLSPMIPLTLEVPNLLHDVSIVSSSAAWTIHSTEEVSPSDIDIRIDEGAATWVVGVAASFSDAKTTSGDLKKSFSASSSTCFDNKPEDSNNMAT